MQWLRLEKAAPKAPAEPAPADPKGGKKKEAVEAKVFRAVETITDQLQNDLRKVKEAVLAKRYAQCHRVENVLILRVQQRADRTRRRC